MRFGLALFFGLVLSNHVVHAKTSSKGDCSPLLEVSKIEEARSHIRDFWAPRLVQNPALSPAIEALLGQPFERERNKALAEVLTNKPLTSNQAQSLDLIHSTIFFERKGLPLPRGYGLYTPAQLRTVFLELESSFGKILADDLIRAGVAGSIMTYPRWSFSNAAPGSTAYWQDENSVRATTNMRSSEGVDTYFPGSSGPGTTWTPKKDSAATSSAPPLSRDALREQNQMLQTQQERERKRAYEESNAFFKTGITEDVLTLKEGREFLEYLKTSNGVESEILAYITAYVAKNPLSDPTHADLVNKLWFRLELVYPWQGDTRGWPSSLVGKEFKADQARKAAYYLKYFDAIESAQNLSSGLPIAPDHPLNLLMKRIFSIGFENIGDAHLLDEIMQKARIVRLGLIQYLAVNLKWGDIRGNTSSDEVLSKYLSFRPSVNEVVDIVKFMFASTPAFNAGTNLDRLANMLLSRISPNQVSRRELLVLLATKYRDAQRSNIDGRNGYDEESYDAESNRALARLKSQGIEPLPRPRTP